MGKVTICSCAGVRGWAKPNMNRRGQSWWKHRERGLCPLQQTHFLIWQLNLDVLLLLVISKMYALMAVCTPLPSACYPNRYTQHGSGYWRIMVGGLQGKDWSFTDSLIQESGCKELFRKKVMIEKSSIRNLGTGSFRVIYAALSRLAPPAVIALWGGHGG